MIEILPAALQLHPLEFRTWKILNSQFLYIESTFWV
jgi:hypothetical protein